MAINKYGTLNVLSQSELDKLKLLNNTKEDSINEIVSMINTASNRAQKRRIEKTLNKVEKIQAKCQEVIKNKSDKQLAIGIDNNFMYIAAIVGMVLIEDYHWKEDPDQEHGQIMSFFERMNKKMNKYIDEEYSTEDIIKLLEEQTGLELVSSFKN